MFLANPAAVALNELSQASTLWGWQMGAILGSITITALVSYLVLACMGKVRGVLSEDGIRILVRIMGVLLAALAVQCFVTGLTGLGLFLQHGKMAEADRLIEIVLLHARRISKNELPRGRPGGAPANDRFNKDWPQQHSHAAEEPSIWACFAKR